MRSPVIAFSILAAAAVSPSLVAGAPTSPNMDSGVSHSPRNLHGMALPVALPGLSQKSAQVAATRPNVDDHRAQEQKAHSTTPVPAKNKRASDQYTAGGNSFSGATGNTSGGNAVSQSHGNNAANAAAGAAAVDGVTNEDDVTGGAAGDSFSGFSYGGDGGGHGPGGNAYSGAVASSYGGDVINDSDDGIDNEGDNLGGAGGFDESGDSVGGDAGRRQHIPNRNKRAEDQYTAGGNAYTGASNNVDGGDIINKSEDRPGTGDGTTNVGTQTGGAAGDTYSGEAVGGDGDGYGAGGNAYSGSTGTAKGGSVYNFGETVDNEDTVTGGAGGESESGDAVGGDA